MADVIWKYPLKAEGAENGIVIAMPPLGRILCLQTQDGTPTLWVLFDQQNIGRGEVTRLFSIIGTGDRIETPAGFRKNYIGTYQDEAGEVWHVFEFVDY